MSKTATRHPTPAQIRAARGWLGLSQAAVAAKAGISSRTLLRIEAGNVPFQGETLNKIGVVLQALGIEFLFEADEGVGVRVQASQGTRLPG